MKRCRRFINILKPISVYIHIPFCLSKCGYCDFLSYSGFERYHDGYVDALCLEIKKSAVKLADYSIKTIYFGGGTPTVLRSDLLNKILNELKNNYLIDKNAEITIEANPETCSSDKLSLLFQAGINRISFGVQSWNDAFLKSLGRVHNSSTAEQAVSNAKKAGFCNISIDLMFALPCQKISDWTETLEKTLSLDPEHISCYGLTVEDETPFGLDKSLVLPDDKTDRAMYWRAKEFLGKYGYNHYEISNFAKPNHESRHNNIYWTGGDYIGFGLGAHSLIQKRRFHNIANIGEYMANSFQNGYTEVNAFDLTEAEQRSEFMFLGLRLLKGVSRNLFKQTFNANINSIFGEQIEKLTSGGLLISNNEFIALTEKGIDLANRVYIEFI